jgi:hypothetical protein
MTSTWIIARHRLALDHPATLFLWIIFAVIVAAIGVAMAGFGVITGSVWEPAGHVPRWFAAAIGFSLTRSSLPLVIAHGYTRREFAAQLPLIIAGFAATLSALMAAGFAVETIIYRVADLPLVLSRSHLFDAPDQLPLVFAEFVLLLPVWTVSGALVGAGFARNTSLGALLVPAGLVVVTLAEFTVGPGYLAPPVFGLARLVARLLTALDLGPGSVPAAVATCVAMFGLGMAGIWALIRDIPVRTKPA